MTIRVLPNLFLRILLKNDDKGHGTEIAKGLQGLSELIVWTSTTLCA